jgi:parallel beta-helix repeat protein
MPNLAAVILVVLSASGPSETKPIVITRDTVLDKNALLNHGIVIEADGVTLDGNGATLVGPGKPGDLKTFTGVGVQARGCSNVTIRNLKVKGFESALLAQDGAGWLIEGCDFSDNFHDPEFGWGERKPMGGMVLKHISKSVLRNNKANRVWDGLSLIESDDNEVAGNDLSHCSDVCLKMWIACRNVVSDNNLSYGLRIKPGEVHARDSTSVLIESGSNDNRFYRNDITHGGDGVFIRVLNGWVSTGNLFVENDCSYANNNGFEAWSPGNTYIRNKANHCSYGFWLGGSDQTVLTANEAAYNGQPDGFHNAPEPGFVHGGIVIVGGAASHCLLDGNHCHHNNGGGIVFRGNGSDKGLVSPIFHWIVQRNRLDHNRFGIWGRWGDWISLANNSFEADSEDKHLENDARLTELKPDPSVTRAPVAVLRGTSRGSVGQPVVFDASQSRDPAGRPLTFSWDLGGPTASGPTVEHTFDKPGFYRVGLTVSNGVLADLAFRDLIVAEEVKQEIGTEGQAARWGSQQENDDGSGKVLFSDDPDAVAGKTSLRWRPDPYRGMYATAIFPKTRDAGWDLSSKKTLIFWLKAQNTNIPGFQNPGPVVTLYTANGSIKIEPSEGRNLLVNLPFSEARWTWMRVEVPLAGNADWKREDKGAVGLDKIDAVGVSLDSWGNDPFDIWLDGLQFE